MKEDILFIGIGQAGSNIAYALKQKGFQTFYINSTNDDVKLLEIPDNLKYHIPGATGCGRNRMKALNYTKEHFNNIDNIIMTKFPMFKHIYICFSTGGGTGSGISPALLSVLSKKYQDKNLGYIAVLPKSSESVDVKTNAIECYKQLQSLEYTTNNFFLDNNSSVTDFLEINKIFADDFDRFVDIINNKSTKGNIDDDELEKLIMTKGNVVFAENIDGHLQVSPVFSKCEKVCEKAFIINNKDNEITIDTISEKFSKPIRVFTGYNDDVNSYAGLFGLNMPTSRILELQEEILKDNEIIKINQEKRNSQKLDFVIPDTLKENTQKVSQSATFDLESEFDAFLL